jgi:hypothetical protein
VKELLWDVCDRPDVVDQMYSLPVTVEVTGEVKEKLQDVLLLNHSE